MNTIQAIVTALCLWCSATTPAQATNRASEECFTSKKMAWQIYPGEHLWRHKTPNGMCWHIGSKNRSGVFATETTTKEITKHTSNGITQSGSSHISKWGGNAKPGYLYLGAIPIPYDVDVQKYEWGSSWLRTAPKKHGR